MSQESEVMWRVRSGRLQHSELGSYGGKKTCGGCHSMLGLRLRQLNELAEVVI